ncbi:hypothetical protein D8Y20_13155 [Mariprofundus sp. EBB-1]|uniref:glycosyl hydrolase family 8 n=1 Tax=Mariprofundus sp. EBB-1 TaxID=2650971 RepID=UPI000EF1978C|nr:glycosyl hydrolase family 8 [Mariprofundus sp. EBB-1]RLL49182.1 hypothetical protein D8Y20_13155 [Mariprofundus sp. EBB-1]
MSIAGATYPARYAIWALMLMLMQTGCSQGSGQSDLWKQYKAHFLNEGSSIVDVANDSIRHSEGQGMGMLLAEANADRKSFDAIWQWTQQHLQVRDKDHLLAWRWQPSMPHVTDFNNASDGDILVAWALLRAAERWNEKKYDAAARLLLHDIRQHLVKYQHGRMLLLPGVEGFMKDEGAIINLSYWVYPALEKFKQVEPDEAAWPGLISSGLKLSGEALFGAWKLPSDWIIAGETLYPALQFPKRFGLDAVRIPLYLAWAGYMDHPAVLRSAHFWQQFTGASAWPEWASLDDTNVHMADKVQGIQAVAALIDDQDGDWSDKKPVMSWETPEYYQATLLLISQLASMEKGQ